MSMGCLLCFDSGKFEEYRGVLQEVENIDFDVMIITHV
jgi:hypothetical protein